MHAKTDISSQACWRRVVSNNLFLLLLVHILCLIRSTWVMLLHFLHGLVGHRHLVHLLLSQILLLEHAGVLTRRYEVSEGLRIELLLCEVHEGCLRRVVAKVERLLLLILVIRLLRHWHLLIHEVVLAHGVTNVLL